MDLDEKTFADYFQAAGYRTAAFGKWHNGSQYPFHPMGRGFDGFYGFTSGHWGNYFNPPLEHNGTMTRGQGFIIDDLTDRAINFIETNKDDPFLIYLPYNTPHSPMQVPDRWYAKFQDMDMPEHRFSDRENVDHTRAAYAMCENIDWNIDRLTDAIREYGLEENTIVVYMSDNGPNGWRWNGGLKGIKGSNDEGGVRSPFVISWKGVIPEGRVVSKIAAAFDIFPTLLDLVNIDIQPRNKLDGRSLKKLILEDEPNWEERKIVSYWRGKTSVRSDKYLLDPRNRLYDLSKDIGQVNDLSDRNPDIVADLIDFRNNWNSEVLAELPDIDDRPIPVGHPDFPVTYLPARDGKPHGNIRRSNRYPNDSYFTNWIAVSDSITWDIEVFDDWIYQVELYYTCRESDVGSIVELKFDLPLQFMIEDAHDPPEQGAENDRVPRIESYVKDFKVMNAGMMGLTRGRGRLTMKATHIANNKVIDLRMISFTKVKP